MFERDDVHALSTLPATDGNFTSTLRTASTEDVMKAIEVMENNGGQNKSRIAACKRELRKRGIKA